jgi:O-antigen/teichoic acid export membrane protein
MMQPLGEIHNGTAFPSIFYDLSPAMSLLSRITAIVADEVRLVQWFMVCRLTGVLLSSVVIARTLEMGDVGIVEMLAFCGYIITFFWAEALLKAFLARKKGADQRQETSSFLLIILLISIGAMMVLLLGRRWIIPVLTDRPELEGLAVFIVYQALIIPIGLMPFLGIMRRFNIILLSLFVLIGPAFAAYAGTKSIAGVNGVLIGWMSYSLVGFIWLLFTNPLSRNIAIGTLWRQLWPLAWPLMLYTIAAGLARSFDAWLVARHFDESVFALFRYGAREFPLVLALAGGLSTTMIGKLMVPGSETDLRQRSERLMHVCYPLIAACMLVSVPLFEIVFGPEYRDSAWIFNVYLLLTLFQLVFPQTIMTARGDTRWLWYVSMAELVINIVASVILLKVMGLIGIAFGTLIAFCAEKIMMLILVRKKYALPANAFVPVRTWSLYALLLLTTYFISQWVFSV